MRGHSHVSVGKGAAGGESSVSEQGQEQLQHFNYNTAFAGAHVRDDSATV